MSKTDDTVGRFFDHQATALQGIVNATRDIIDHALSKGVEAESALAEMLASFLPGRFDGRKGFLLDSTGVQSHELDLIIVDRQHIARMFDFRSFEVVPIEAASAGVEVKTTLNKAELADTFERFQQIQDMHFNEERLLLPYTNASETGLAIGTTSRPELAIFAFDGEVSSEAVSAVYKKHPSLERVKICILQKGLIGKIAGSEVGPLGFRWVVPQGPQCKIAGGVLTFFLYHFFLPAILQQRKGSDFYRHYLRGNSIYRELK